MLVRVVDYQANPGGGCRFVAQMLRALRRVTTAEFELVTYSRAVETYRALVGSTTNVIDIAPRNARRMSPPWAGKPGARLLNAIFPPHFHFDVPAAAMSDCDVVWFPWLHRHRVTAEQATRSVATFHDCISLEFPGVLPPPYRDDEFLTTRGWISSGARIVITSNSTGEALERLFGTRGAQTSVIPLSAKHAAPAPRQLSERPFRGRPYVLCPSNISPHKNLETLIDGFAAWGARIPLVITGPGTDLRDRMNPRQCLLRDVMERCGLEEGRDVFGLGYVEDAEYYGILDGAWAMVIPTLAEGGGSFPALEAMERGIPVLCSDIPVLQEMSDRWNGRAMWFDPRDPSDLAAKLSELEGGYDDHRRLAHEQALRLLQRTWDQVAIEYAAIMQLPLRDTTASAGSGKPTEAR